MRPTSALLVAALFLLPLAPGALANYVVDGTSPEVLCVLVLDEGGPDACRVTGTGVRAGQLRIRIAAGPAAVSAYADRLLDPATNHWDQVGALACSGIVQTCVVGLQGVVGAAPYDGTFFLSAKVSSAARGAVVIVSLEPASPLPA